MICDFLLVVAGMLLGVGATLIFQRVRATLRERRARAARVARLERLGINTNDCIRLVR